MTERAVDFFKLVQDTLTYIVVTVIGALLTGTIWLVRRVIFHQKQIALLEQEAAHRAAQREEDRADIHEIRVKMDATHALLVKQLESIHRDVHEIANPEEA